MIHIIARSSEYANLMKSRHPALIKHMIFHFNTKSYLEVVNNIIVESDAVFCIMHDDVFLPKNFLLMLDRLKLELDRDWPGWGVCGNAGILPFYFNKQKDHILRYLSDPHGGPNAQAGILPAQLIDGNVMLVNGKALNNGKFSIPAIDGFQFYDSALCIASITAGCAVLVAPHLCCYHDSGGSQSSFDLFTQNTQVTEFLNRNLKNRSINTLNGTVVSSGDLFRDKDIRIDLEIDSLKVAARGRPIRQVAIVVRTQFKNNQLLKRTLETCTAFIAAAGDASSFKLCVITDKIGSIPAFATEYAEVISISLENVTDSRNLLVKMAFESIVADWFWFIDDDDWMFPNEAERLSYVISTVKTSSIIFVGCQHFYESIEEGVDSFEREDYSIADGRYFDPRLWYKSMEGKNHIPFPGMLISSDVYQGIDQTIFTDITYFEDFALQLSSLADSSRFVAIVDKLYVGISVRTSGNTITEKDRTKWNTSLAELSSKLCNDESIKYLSRI